MDNRQFEELVSRLIDEDVSSSEMEELIDLAGEDESRLSFLVEQLETSDLISQSLDELRQSSLFVAAVDSRLGEDPFVTRLRAALGNSGKSNNDTEQTVHQRKWLSRDSTRAFVLLTSLVIVFLLGFIAFQPPDETRVATITGLSGSLQWTGDGGVVSHELQVGDHLSGGTIEGLAPDSWFELRFTDGSTVSISGNSMLTFSETDQKHLRLREGNMTAEVTPQPKDRPMLVFTRSAMLEVLGTKFEVEAEPWSTVLNVDSGKVRLKRLSDGEEVHVAAQQRVVSSEGSILRTEPIPESTSSWTSRIQESGERMLGRWLPPGPAKLATLHSVPFSLPDDRTIFAIGVGVSEGDSRPVVTNPTSQIRIDGRMRPSKSLFIGVTLRHRNGDFAGRFQTILPAAEFSIDEPFHVDVSLSNFKLDPSLNGVKNTLPARPFDLVVESIWCHSLYDRAGLRVTSIELLAQNDK